MMRFKVETPTKLEHGVEQPERRAEPRASAWVLPREVPTLARNEVHVWLVDLAAEARGVGILERFLDDGERIRAARFMFEQDRRRFTISHGVLRVLLGGYLGIEPGEVCFSYGRWGKPALAEGSKPTGLCFNLSYSYRLALYAFARGREVGIDIEYVQPSLAEEQVAEQFFSPRERADLRALPPHVWDQAFFQCWTRKEAYVKARGKGLSLRLDQFDVSVAPGSPAALLATRGDPQEAPRWSLQSLAPGLGYVAALAAEGTCWRLKSWRWPSDVLDVGKAFAQRPPWAGLDALGKLAVRSKS